MLLECEVCGRTWGWRGGARWAAVTGAGKRDANLVGREVLGCKELLARLEGRGGHGRVLEDCTSSAGHIIPSSGVSLRAAYRRPKATVSSGSDGEKVDHTADSISASRAMVCRRFRDRCACALRGKRKGVHGYNVHLKAGGRESQSACMPSIIEPRLACPANRLFVYLGVAKSTSLRRNSFPTTCSCNNLIPVQSSGRAVSIRFPCLNYWPDSTCLALFAPRSACAGPKDGRHTSLQHQEAPRGERFMSKARNSTD